MVEARELCEMEGTRSGFYASQQNYRTEKYSGCCAHQGLRVDNQSDQLAWLRLLVQSLSATTVHQVLDLSSRLEI